MTSKYTSRLIWERSPTTEREEARSKAHALLRQIEEMEFSRRPRSAIWRVAVNARAFAILGEDRVAAANADEIIDRVKLPKYSAAERVAIYRKALALLAGLKPSRPVAGKNRTETYRRKTTAYGPGLSPAELKRVRAWLAREHKRLGR